MWRRKTSQALEAAPVSPLTWLPCRCCPYVSNRQALYHVDLALACVFTLNWAFWFWVAEDRIKYVFSFLTLIDAITIIPAFALYSLGAIVNTNVPGLNFLRVLR